MGVSRKDIFYNNYFDGPFDQVPPRLPLRDKLHAAYPYTNYSGGIDEHGNFHWFKSSRVAISPYYDYLTAKELVSYHQRCHKENNKSAFWSCLAYELKKDFHKTLDEYNNETNQTVSYPPNYHPIYVTQGWPANHEGNISLEWSEWHTQALSSAWPKNHKTEISEKTEKDKNK